MGEVDRVIRQNLSEKLLNKSPTPLWPGNWGGALNELKQYVGVLGQQFNAVRQDPQQAREMSASITPFLVFMAFALLTMLLVQPWVINRLDRFSQSLTRKSQILICNLFSTLLRLFFPLLTAFLLIVAIGQLKLPLPSVKATISALAGAAVYIVVSHWLGFLIFRPRQQSSE